MKVPSWVFIALREFGQEEIAGAAANDRILLYQSTVGNSASDEVPWCAAFVNWVLKQAGIEGSGRANAKSFLEWGDASACQCGAIAVMHRGNAEWMGHVSIVLEDKGDYLITIGGNQGNRVSFTTVRKSLVISYRMPKFNGQF